MTKLLFLLKGHRHFFGFVSCFPWRLLRGHSAAMAENCKWDLMSLSNSNVLNASKVSPGCLWNLGWQSHTSSVWIKDFKNFFSSSLSVSVSAHVGGPHRGRVVIPDERQHYYQRLHWSHTQGLERRDRRMYPHPLWAYLNSALHAPTREKVWERLCREPVASPLGDCVSFDYPKSLFNWK